MVAFLGLLVFSACNDETPAGDDVASDDTTSDDSTSDDTAADDSDDDSTSDDDDACTVRTWYIDSDGDGYGVDGTTQSACTKPTGYASNSTDCDDSNENVNPGQGEILNDSVDNNCNEEVDEVTIIDGYSYNAIEIIDGATGSIFTNPLKLAVDDDDTIYAADFNNDRITVIDSERNVTYITNDGGNYSGDITPVNFSSPRGVAVDNRGVLYIADSGNNRIVQLDSLQYLLGTTSSWGVSLSDLFGNGGIYDIGIDNSNDHPYVAGGLLVSYDNSLQPLTAFEDLTGCYGMGVGSDGLIYAINSVDAGGGNWSSTVKVFDASDDNLTPETSIATIGESADLGFAYDVTTDSDGSIYVSDSDNNRIVVFDELGEMLGSIENFLNPDDNSAETFSYPTDVAIGTNGNAYVMDHDNNRIVVFEKTLAE